jgi:hypothetical protein
MSKKTADGRPCEGILCNSDSKFQYASGTVNRYKAKACPGFCVPGSKDPLCKKCVAKKTTYEAGEEKRYSDAIYHGMSGKLRKESHIEGSNWNRDLRKKELLEMLKKTPGLQVYEGASQKAVAAVKKAATVVAAAEKQKAVALTTIQEASRREETAINSASAAVARLSVIPPQLPPARKESAPRSIPRANTATRKNKKGSRSSSGSKSKSRRARRRSSGSIRGLAGTPRERSPGMISSPNIAEVNSGYSTNVPVYPEDVRKYTLDSMGRPMERIPLPAPRGPKIGSMD